MKYLVVNADDYGMAASVSAGIRQAHLGGIVTSTTVMMNMPDAESAVRQAPPTLGVGVHLNITEGVPILPASQLPHLLSLSDGVQFADMDTVFNHAHDLPVAEITAEWRAQIERYRAISGRNPDHLDSHHHSSYYSHALYEVMLGLADEYRCALRLPYREDEPPVPRDLLSVPADFPEDESPRDMAGQRGLRFPHRFISSFYDEGVSFEALMAILDGLDDGVTELMAHPALADAGLEQITTYNWQRAKELELLTHPQVTEKIETLGIRLITFADLLTLPH